MLQPPGWNLHPWFSSENKNNSAFLSGQTRYKLPSALRLFVAKCLCQNFSVLLEAEGCSREESVDGWSSPKVSQKCLTSGFRLCLKLIQRCQRGCFYENSFLTLSLFPVFLPFTTFCVCVFLFCLYFDRTGQWIEQETGWEWRKGAADWTQ